MKKLLISSLFLISLSVSLWADEHYTTEVNSFTSERIGLCIAIHYSDVKNRKDLYNFFTVAKISSIKLLANKDGKLFIRIVSGDETADYIFAQNNRKNALLALQSLITSAYAGHKSNSKDKLDLFIDR